VAANTATITNTGSRPNPLIAPIRRRAEAKPPRAVQTR